MVKYRIVMPKHLREEQDKLVDIMASRHDPDEEIEPKDFIAELRALCEEHGSPELRAWHKEVEETVADNRRRGVELS